MCCLLAPLFIPSAAAVTEPDPVVYAPGFDDIEGAALFCNLEPTDAGSTLVVGFVYGTIDGELRGHDTLVLSGNAEARYWIELALDGPTRKRPSTATVSASARNVPADARRPLRPRMRVRTRLAGKPQLEQDRYATDHHGRAGAVLMKAVSVILASFALALVAPAASAASSSYGHGLYHIEGSALACNITPGHATIVGFDGTINGVPKTHVVLDLTLFGPGASCSAGGAPPALMTVSIHEVAHGLGIP